MTKKITEAEAIKLTIEETIEGIQIIDPEWRYVYINAAVERQGRKPREELLGRTMMECYPGIEEQAFFKDLQHVMKTGEPRRFENEFEYPDKRKGWFELFIEPCSQGVLIRSIEIDERKKLEDQLRHAQKMDAIGRLAGGIAHDFNNNLAVMLAYAEMLMDYFNDKNSEGKSYTEKILTAIHQSTSLTKQLLAFSRKQVLDLRVTNLNTLLENLKENLEKLIGETIHIEYNLAKNLQNVKVDPTQIDQVIINLSVNARDAMIKGGKLSIETSNVELDEEYARLHPGVVPGKYVMMCFSDTGSGMTQDIQNRIFEPFFTTKEKGKGTGLGLATVHGIIKQSRGHIWVYSEPGMGAVFKIFFPMIMEKNQEVKDTKVIRPNYKGNETILLVEDNNLLRDGYKTALEGAGYKVLAAANPHEAQKVFASANSVDLMLTDVVLPKMTGKELSEILRSKKSDLKVVYMSGYTENSIIHQGILDTESVLLQKPISIQLLLETIEKVLQGLLKKGVL